MDGAGESVVVAAPRPAARRSYVARHWRGELSLPVSYWINGWLGDLPVILLAVGAAFAAAAADLYTFGMIAGLATWLVAIVVSLWQLVGIWRSAGHHVARGGRRLWARLAQASVVAGALSLVVQLYTSAIPQAAEILRIWSGDKELAAHQIRVLPGGTEMLYSGAISFGVTDEVRRLLDRAPHVTVLHLDSPGGRLIEAQHLRDLVAARGLVTYVGAFCASACTTVFMGGRARYIARDAKLGFHQPSGAGGSALTTALETARERATLLRAGVAAEFAARAYDAPPSGMWYPSVAELLRAHVVTGIAAPGQFAADR